MTTAKQGKGRKKERFKSTVQKPVPQKTSSVKTKYSVGLEKPRRLFEQGKFQEAFESAKVFLDKQVLGADPQAYYFAGRLASFAAASLNQHTKAIQIAEEILVLDNTLADFHYLLAFCYNQTGEYENSRLHAEVYLKLYKSQKNSKKKLAFDHTTQYLHDIYNYLGCACKELKDYPAAREAFAQAHKVNPGYVPAYLNHAQMLHGLKLDQEACQILKQAHTAGLDNPEIDMLLKAYSSASSISVCMIVKNEEKYLDNCLSSLKNFADEIIVVDTGSTDSTVEIAKKHGARVYFHKWENDFSKARNYSLSYATKEWIFIIDADEELFQEDIPLLKEAVSQNEYNVVSINVYNLGENKRFESASFLPSIRMFRRKVGACYSGIVHNQLFFNPEKEVVLRVGARIRHYGYSLNAESMKRKQDRSRALLLQQLEDDPDNAFAHFNLAQLYRGESNNPSPQNCHQVIGHAQKVLALTDPHNKRERGIHLMALHQLTTAYQFLGEYDHAIEYCFQALEHKADYIDPLLSLGNNYGLKNDLKNSRKWYGQYLEVLDNYNETDETDQIIFLYLKNRHSAYYGLAVISETEDKTAEAIEWFKKTLQACPNYLDSHFRLGRLLYNCNHLGEALFEMQNEISNKPSNWAAQYVCGEIYARQKNYEMAQKAYKEGLKYAPNDPNLLYSLAKVLRDNNKSDEALGYLKQIFSTNTNLYEYFRLLGDIYFEQTNYTEACSAYTNYVIRYPENSEVWNNLGNAHYKLNEYEQARDCYLKAVELDSTYSLAHRNLALAYTKMKQTEKAYELLSEYIQLAAEDFDLLKLTADLARTLKKHDRAIIYYEKCLRLNPNSTELIISLSDCYRDDGNIESARMGYKQALKINPGYEPALTRLETINAMLVTKK